MANPGLIVVKSNEQLDKEAAAATAPPLLVEGHPLPMASNLTAFLRNQWEEAKREKIPFQDQILKNERARNGIYDPDKLAEIKAIGAPEIFMMITDAKCRSAEAWVKDIVQQPGASPPFAIEPSPIPTIPPPIKQQFETQFYMQAVQQVVTTSLAMGMPLNGQEIGMQLQALLPEVEKDLKRAIMDWSKEQCQVMTTEIHDQFVEGGWFKAFSDCIPDIILKTGIIKGPTARQEKVRQYKTDANGMMDVTYVDKVVDQFERRNPLDIYPGPGGINFDDTYLFDKQAYSPAKIAKFKGIPGFIEKEISAVLEECQNGKIFKEWTEIDQTRARAEGMNPDMIYDWQDIHVLEYWGDIQGRMLLEWDSDGKANVKNFVTDPDQYYPINAHMIGNHVIRAVKNDEPMGHKPYSKCSFVENANSFWGKGLPELISDVQRACNASARALLYNVGMSSGPQVEINEDRLADGEQAQLVPWKRWFVTNDTMLKGGKAIEFYAPPFVAEKLIAVFQFYLKIADEHSGVPAYAHGDPQVGGAGNTASGLSMLMTQAARGIKLLIKNMDEKIIAEDVERQFELNVRRKKFTAILGDLHVIAKGSASLIAKEQEAARLTELLTATTNPMDYQIMGTEGRKELLRQVVRTHEQDPEKIVPDLPAMQIPYQGAAPSANPTNTLNAAGEPAQGTDFQTVQGRGGAPIQP